MSLPASRDQGWRVGTIIRNRDTLLAHGNADGRQVVLDILEHGLAAPDPYPNVRKMLRIEDGKLIVGHPDFSPLPEREPQVFDLSEIGDIYVVGGGKAAQREAEAVEDVLGDLITDGQINAKKGDTVRLKRIPVTLAGHPIPDEESVAGGRRIIEIERRAKKGDIVFVCASGGATSLTAVPVPGVSLADLQEVYRVLYFGAGANMPAANAVRNHLALVNTKHGRYVGEATMIQILTTENPPDLRVHLFERGPDRDPYDAAIGVLKSHGCWDLVSQSVRDFLDARDPRYGPVRPSEVAGKPQRAYRVMGPEYMIAAAKSRAEELGLRAAVLASSLSDVEAQPVAHTFAYMAQQVEKLGQPFEPPCVLLCGGELVVSTGDSTGVGGRSQEFTLTMAARIAGSEHVVVGSADSDGSDGPTPAAGGIVDGETWTRARDARFDVDAELANHNSHVVLETLGDAIYTGIRGTNVRDLRVVFVGGRA